MRSFEQVADLKHAVDDALACKAQHLQHAHGKSTNIQRLYLCGFRGGVEA
jgi:hypothetical protein